MLIAICLAAGLQWPQSGLVFPACGIVILLTFCSLFVLPGMRWSAVQYAQPRHALNVFTVFAVIASLSWAFLFFEMISAAPIAERVGWITVTIAFISIGTTTFALLPRASGIYCFNLALALWLTIWAEDLTMPMATKLLLPLFGIMVHQATVRTYNQFRSHLVADWTLRRHQAQRQAEEAEASARKAREMVEAHMREEAAERAARTQAEEQRAAIAEQKRKGTIEIADHYERSVVAHRIDLEDVVGSLVDAIERINKAGAAVRSSAETMLDLAANSTEATRSVAASTESLSVTADDIGSQVQQQRAAARRLR